MTTLLASAAMSGVAHAQETGDAPPPTPTQPASVEGSRSYTPADFARFAPRTALDMLRQVPGFSIEGVSQERGLGQASGNVLINGQRISGKSNDAVTELGRISADSVVRIDIVDGATLNIAGLAGEVANVIVKAGGAKGQFEYRPEFRARNTDPVLTRGAVSLSGETGPIGYTVGLRNDANAGGADGRTTIFGPDGSPIDFRDEYFSQFFDQPKLSGSIKYDGPGSQVGNLNGSFQLFLLDFIEVSRRSGPGQVDRTRRFIQTENEHNYEVGGDYEWALGPGRLKLIGLHRFEHSPSVTTSVISFADASASTGSRFTQTGDETETVGRIEYRLKSGRSDWQFSGEAAFNSLDNVSGLFVLDPDGEFEEVPLPGGTAKVTEQRYEIAATYGRTLSPKLSIQASLGGEYSKLEQTGEFGKSRAFFRPKGFVSAAWKPNSTLDVNGKLERSVGQLNFFDFLASVNLGGGSQNESNPDLVPPQSWDAEVELRQNLGRYGNTTLKIYGQLIDDIIDQVPIGELGEAPGNIERATVLGLDWRSTFQMEPLGLRGAKLDTRLQLQRTRLDDPLTGEPRPISGELVRFAEAILRYDIPETDWAVGSSASHFRPSKNFRLRQLVFSNEGPVFLNAYVENKDVFGLTVRATVGNLLDANSILDRINYVGRRNGPVSFVEERRRKIGPIFSFAVSGSF
ncbi:TonB-dependent receptor plug domain-containing protein [Allosphingosinicella sp.]|uniref:TonB-dependent receptor plug domain-containing protein n=1 Tax=Allosphingosinicella sp. TaxID=2823234 RepID=UPI003D755254